MLSSLAWDTDVWSTALAAEHENTEPFDRERRLLKTIVRLGAPAAMARVRRNGREFVAATGVADRRNNRPAARTDTWRIASVTKLVSAHVAVSLSSQGRFDLDRKLKSFNTSLPARVGNLTVRALLDHSSRVPEYLDYSVFGQTAAAMVASTRGAIEPEKLLADALAQPWYVDPLAEQQYANTNYVLLQHVLEQASGRAFAALVDEEIIAPLNLAKTGFPASDGRLPLQHLHGYVRADTQNRPFSSKTRFRDVTRHGFFLGADGGLYSNLSDLSRIMDFIWARNRVDGRNLARLTGDLKADHDGFFRYGYGVMAVRLSCGVTVFGHEGLDLGSTTLAFADRSNATQMILVANLGVAQFDPVDKVLRAFREAVFCQ